MVKNRPRDSAFAQKQMSFSHVIRNDSPEFNLILMLLQPGTVTSDSERSHTKKTQRAVILLIAKMAKAERTKAQSSHYSESKERP